MRLLPTLAKLSVDTVSCADANCASCKAGQCEGCTNHRVLYQGKCITAKECIHEGKLPTYGATGAGGLCIFD